METVERVENKWWDGIDMMRQKYSETLCPSQITNGLAWDRTDTSVMIHWRLTT
jgi:hypothetical protein